MKIKGIVAKPVKHFYGLFTFLLLSLIALILLTIFCAQNYNKDARLILLIFISILSLAYLLLIPLIISRDFTDYFTKEGITRKKGKKIIREITWEEVGKVDYHPLTFANTIIPVFHHITFYLKEDHTMSPNNFFTFANKKGDFITYLSDKKLKQILQLYSLNIYYYKTYFSKKHK